VLEKCGFVLAGIQPHDFPNLSPPRAPAAMYRLDLRAPDTLVKPR
jgi:hypothetical protein